ncbi:MDR family MFS transporter [Pseudonocardia sp. WMMC193]|uniref:MDR family MFS transporter n=1 Tax=Pseudonocardia sp. WMMC193 TaxID=2911965 RepID=UPI001F02E015|nr:MDR family MFS transporter [Pseudonocardia sp. WMMC193]MCF7548446.1 DHA2 family efflux MFS transporter permease subunit [Pseudonocardia sp. WMMC193]
MSTLESSVPPPPPPPPTPSVRTGPVIALLVASAFVVILNETIMGVALPALMVDLDITASSAQWLTTGFMLTMAVVIPTTGLLLQRFSVRTVFFLAMGLFTAGTAIAAAAPGFELLLVGRIVQASGTAVMLPLLFTTVMTVVEPERRGRMTGVITIVIAVAPAIGPTISGLVLASLHWRWMFLVVLPIALLSMALGALWVRNVTETRPVQVDVLSIVLSALGFGALVYGLAGIGEAAEGHAPVPLWIPLTVGTVSLVAFVLRQIALRETPRVLLDLRAFRSPAFSLAVAMVVVSFTALFGTLILLPIYLQSVLGLSTLDAGLALLPGGALMGVLAPIVGGLFDRFGPRPLVLPGAIVASAALWWMTTLDATSPVGLVIAMHLTLTAGLGFLLTPLMTSALGSLPVHLYSHGSAIVTTLQQVAGAAGTALFVTLMSVGTAGAASTGADGVSALATGVHTAFLVGAAISVVAILLAMFVRRAPEGSRTPTPTPH